MHHLLICILRGTRSELKGREGLRPWPSIAHHCSSILRRRRRSEEEEEEEEEGSDGEEGSEEGSDDGDGEGSEDSDSQESSGSEDEQKVILIQGHPGEVVGIDGDGDYKIKWIAPTSIRHCDNCVKEFSHVVDFVIQGPRWECIQCAESGTMYDLCKSCYDKFQRKIREKKFWSQFHNEGHTFSQVFLDDDDYITNFVFRSESLILKVVRDPSRQANVNNQIASAKKKHEAEQVNIYFIQLFKSSCCFTLLTYIVLY